MGILPLNGWWTSIDGYVFNDANRNGKSGTPASRACPNFTLDDAQAGELADGPRHDTRRPPTPTATTSSRAPIR